MYTEDELVPDEVAIKLEHITLPIARFDSVNNRDIKICDNVVDALVYTDSAYPYAPTAPPFDFLSKHSVKQGLFWAPDQNIPVEHVKLKKIGNLLPLLRF